MADISQVILPGGETPQNIKALKIPYGTCSTAAATAAKTVTIKSNNSGAGNNAPFVLEVGAIIAIKFTVTNTATNPTLNVNGTGAKAIYYRGSAIAKGNLAANRTYQFVYNGTQWEFVGDIDTNTNTDTKTRQTLASGDTNRPLLMAYSSNTDTTSSIDNVCYRNNSIYANPSTGIISANGVSAAGNILSLRGKYSSYYTEQLNIGYNSQTSYLYADKSTSAVTMSNYIYDTTIKGNSLKLQCMKDSAPVNYLDYNEAYDEDSQEFTYTLGLGAQDFDVLVNGQKFDVEAPYVRIMDGNGQFFKIENGAIYCQGSAVNITSGTSALSPGTINIGSSYTTTTSIEGNTIGIYGNSQINFYQKSSSNAAYTEFDLPKDFTAGSQHTLLAIDGVHTGPGMVLSQAGDSDITIGMNWVVLTGTIPAGSSYTIVDNLSGVTVADLSKYLIYVQPMYGGSASTMHCLYGRLTTPDNIKTQLYVHRQDGSATTLKVQFKAFLLKYID